MTGVELLLARSGVRGAAGCAVPEGGASPDPQADHAEAEDEVQPVISGTKLALLVLDTTSP
jgi:hypothetical protein